ncbi:hypothetical protein BH23CHL5_BH23CHL5_12580 [soil metagenome]
MLPSLFGSRALPNAGCAPATFENGLSRCGYEFIGGVDEAGRGALAGPLVAAVVLCRNGATIHRLQKTATSALMRDSKTLTASQRLKACEVIRDLADGHSIGVVSAAEIDESGISAANRMAMERAVNGLPNVPEFLMIDAMTIDSAIPQCGLIDGDARSILIAAASILAKVTRDSIMEAHERQFRHYSFSRHRGYGTATHLDELMQSGPCAIHRMSFAPVRRHNHRP